jgi:hypothetical protein
MAGVLPESDRNRAINLTHQLIHVQRMSIREAQRALLAHGIHRSIGSVHADLARGACERCMDVAPDG